MKKVFFLSLLFLFFLHINKVRAADQCGFTLTPKPFVSQDGKLILNPPVNSINFNFDGDTIKSKFTQGEFKNIPSGGSLLWSFPSTLCGNPEIKNIKVISDIQSIDKTLNIAYNNDFNICANGLTSISNSPHQVQIIYKYLDSATRTDVAVPVCAGNYYVLNDESQLKNGSCNIDVTYKGQGDTDSDYTITVNKFTFPPPTSTYGEDFQLKITLNGQPVSNSPYTTYKISNRASGFSPTEFIIPLEYKLKPDNYTVLVERVGGYSSIPNITLCGPYSFEVAQRGATPKPTKPPIPTPINGVFCSDSDKCDNRICQDDPAKSYKCSTCSFCEQKGLIPSVAIPNLKPLCEQLATQFQQKCKECVNSPDRKDNPPGDPTGQGGIWSAIGCLPTDFSKLINKYVFTTGVGIAGSIAFLYFIYGAFMILTSSGNAEKMEEAKQIITSSLAGLLLIIFSIFLLKVIGVDILQLPGFGG